MSLQLTIIYDTLVERHILNIYPLYLELYMSQGNVGQQHLHFRCDTSKLFLIN